MAKLKINTRLNSVVICGTFCAWDMDAAERVNRQPKAKNIVFDDMPRGEYKIFSAETFLAGEVYPTDGRPMGNRYFTGTHDVIINVFFKEDL